jgi:anti-anti-sigma factor
VCLIRLSGDLDAATTPPLTEYLRQQTSTHPKHLVLDLADVRFLASARLGLILTAQSNADGMHGRLPRVSQFWLIMFRRLPRRRGRPGFLVG